MPIDSLFNLYFSLLSVLVVFFHFHEVFLLFFFVLFLLHASFGAHGKSTAAGAADDVMFPLYIIHFAQYTTYVYVCMCI